MDRLTLLKIFVSVADTGSFSGTAELTNQTQSQVSKMIRRLEEELKVTLFTRTTRQISLTEEGEQFLIHARAIVDRLDMALEELHGYKAELRGQLRILTSDGTGRTIFMDVLTRFLEKYPFIKVDHIVSDRLLNLTENQIDVALWLGELKDTSFKARKIGIARRITVASPEYLKRHGIPEKPEDLSHHDCIIFNRLPEYMGLGRKVVWAFETENQEQKNITVFGRYSTDNSSLVREAALKGLGVYHGPSYLFAQDLKEGRLVEVLRSYSFNSSFDMRLLYAAHGFVPLRLRVFIDFFAHEFSLNPVVAL